ncbi:hypothetical protein [Natrialbaceae archaeon AArc-T1-2]|uniref:hypothetical protein n=1 Tax=Natrialbaceae archaeon AArc-T1-2 TaxID=3053904 RepID=UPI00255B001A|nr:hypothetical protein [Natrialbaceae archaeon AArc-T1-2]WIV67830.1 hypothetical protein QQ977_03620 [Natrialbaceae archaeon AArc-T1-2]
MSIEFNRTVEEARFHNPLEDFAEDAVEIEHRVDPLTGEQTRIVPMVFPRPEDGQPDIAAFVGDGEDCFFCPGNVEEATPTYPDFVGFDRGSAGEATSFPNLFPYAKHSNVVALTEDHFRPIGEFDAETVADGLACALEYLHAVRDHEAVTFASVNMNILPSSGSSVVHPHLQTIADDHGSNEQRRTRRCEQAYHDDHGSSYWTDLRDRERDGPRHVGTTGDVEWIAPFAPTHQWHVTGITDVTGFPEPGDDVVDDLAAGIENVLSYYADLGLNAHNFALSLSDDPASRAVIDVVARTPFDDHYVTDAYFHQILHNERVVDAVPEAYADDVGEYF